MPALGRVLAYAGLIAAVSFIGAIAAKADTTLLNVPCDLAHELSKDINPLVAADGQKTFPDGVPGA